MRKTLLTVAIFVLGTVFARSQTPLASQDFESGVFPDKGWSVKDDPSALGHWRISTYIPLGGKYNMYIDEKRTEAVSDYDPQKEEFLISPAVTIPAEEEYGVSFLWQGQSIGILDKKSYDFYVSISEDNGATWTKIWSAADKESLEKSGVVYPWANWSKNNSIVSLKAYKGKTIKVAFIYKLLDPPNGNMIKLDNIEFIKHTAIEGPLASGSTSYVFPSSYIGVKQKSAESLFLTNSGVGNLEVLAIEGLDGTDFSTDLKPGSISLSAQKSQTFNVYFTPSETGAASANMVIKTNGGDWPITLSGTKTPIPDGYVLESFEETDFPSAGWKSKEWTRATNLASSGSYSATATFSNLATLTSPRIALAAGKHNVTFEYAVVLGEEVEEVPVNSFYLEFSKNGGTTWSTLWASTDYTDLSYTKIVANTGLITASDNCYFRWTYEILGELSFDITCSSIYLDNVLLPEYYGSNLAPAVAEIVSPLSGAKDTYTNDLALSWKSTLFAKGYKLYLGTSKDNPTSVLNGIDLPATTTSYVVNGLAYNTQYYWKVVPYNDNGSTSNVEAIGFTTMEDKSISTFPYFNGFEDGVCPSVGWTADNKASKGWSAIGVYPYEGKYSIGVFVTENNGYAILQSPEIKVPADRDIQASFVWGNAVPAGLTRATKDIQVSNGDSIYFEVKPVGGNWKTLAFCSQDEENKVWTKQKVLLSQYKGQTIYARWRYHASSISKAGRGALDNIEISYVEDLGVPSVTFKEWNEGRTEIRKEWNASIINYKQTKYSGDIFTLKNEGEKDLDIKSVKFDTEFFKSSGISVGSKIKGNASVLFGIEFNGVKEQAEIKDTMRIEFVDGQIYKFPIHGSATAPDTYCYTFDNLEAFSTTITDFKTIDQDGYSTVPFAGIFFPGKGAAHSYMVMNWEQADWRNINPRSGNQMLAAFGADETSTTPTLEVNDWLITNQLTAKDNAKVRFYAKSYAVDDIWTASKVTVLVSTTDTKTTSFTALPDVNAKELSPAKEWIECVADLSAYKGQKIYVAIKHYAKGGLAMFLDDLYLEHFEFAVAGNRAPSFLSTPPSGNIKIGDTYSYNFTVSDPDNDALKIELKGLPKWLTYTPNEAGNGGLITGVATTSENYLVKIDAKDAEFTTSQEIEINVASGNSVENSTLNAVHIYPNPVSDILYIDGIVNGTVSLTDMTGKVIFSGENVNEVSMSGLSNGIYILRLYLDDAIRTIKVIKK